MSDSISYKIDVDVAGQLRKAVERTITVEAFGKIKTKVPVSDSGSGNTMLRALPGAGNGISFLMITSTVYSEKLKVKQEQSDGSDGTEEVVAVLSEPVALFGSQSVSQLGIADKELKLVNKTNEEAEVHVLVGWDAVDEDPGSSEE